MHKQANEVFRKSFRADFIFTFFSMATPHVQSFCVFLFVAKLTCFNGCWFLIMKVVIILNATKVSAACNKILSNCGRIFLTWRWNLVLKDYISKSHSTNYYEVNLEFRSFIRYFYSVLHFYPQISLSYKTS